MCDLRIPPDGLATLKKDHRCSTRRKLDRSWRYCFGNKLAPIGSNLFALQSQAHPVRVHPYAKLLRQQFGSNIAIPILPANNAKTFPASDKSRRAPVRNMIGNFIAHTRTQFRFRSQGQLIAIAQGTAFPPTKMRAQIRRSTSQNFGDIDSAGNCEPGAATASWQNSNVRVN